MKALVTGMAGFAGNYLTKLLIEEGLDVYGVSKEAVFAPFLPMDRATVHYDSVDIRDQQRIGDLLRSIRPDLIFHLAAKSSPAQSTQCPRETFEVNFGGTLTLLEAVRLHEIRCRFLLVSSSHVYGGFHTDRPVTEEAPFRPETPYAASKVAGEMIAYQYWKAYGIETLRVRAFNHTGPGQGGGFICPDIARKVVEIERGLRPPRLQVSHLSRQIDFSDVRDVVRGYYNALVKGRPGEVYNICSGRGIAVRAIVETLMGGSKKEIDLDPGPPSGATEWNRTMIGDNSRTVRDLGWTPTISFLNTVRDVLEYSRQLYSAASLPLEGAGGCPI